jgi:hypothetical protein
MSVSQVRAWPIAAAGGSVSTGENGEFGYGRKCNRSPRALEPRQSLRSTTLVPRGAAERLAPRRVGSIAGAGGARHAREPSGTKPFCRSGSSTTQHSYPLANFTLCRPLAARTHRAATHSRPRTVPSGPRTSVGQPSASSIQADLASRRFSRHGTKTNLSAIAAPQLLVKLASGGGRLPDATIPIMR